MRCYACRHTLKQMLFAFGLFLFGVASTEAAQTTPSNQEPVPNWVAWKVFHESLVFYNQQSAERVNQMLAEQFALSTAEVASLMSAGQS